MWLEKGHASRWGTSRTEVSAVGDWCEGGEPAPPEGGGPWQKPGAKGGRGGVGVPRPASSWCEAGPLMDTAPRLSPETLLPGELPP